MAQLLGPFFVYGTAHIGDLTINETIVSIIRSVHDRKGAITRAQETRSALEGAVSELVPCTPDTAARYARIRGSLGVPPADAMQLACAASAGTDLFLTNDRKLVGKIVPGIQFVAGLDSNLF